MSIAAIARVGPPKRDMRSGRQRRIPRHDDHRETSPGTGVSRTTTIASAAASPDATTCRGDFTGRRATRADAAAPRAGRGCRPSRRL
jgi:hypothetical protein